MCSRGLFTSPMLLHASTALVFGSVIAVVAPLQRGGVGVQSSRWSVKGQKCPISFCLWPCSVPLGAASLKLKVQSGNYSFFPTNHGIVTAGKDLEDH